MSKNLVTALPALSAFSSSNIRHVDGDEGRKGGKENHPRPRWGKTAKDRRSKAQERNASNRQSRALWQQDPKATASNFPYVSCNGKRNRTRIDRTKKGDIRITYAVK